MTTASRQRSQVRSLVGKGLVDDEQGGGVLSRIGDAIQPVPELGVQVVEIAERAGEEEVLADITERPLDLALCLCPIGVEFQQILSQIFSLLQPAITPKLPIVRDHLGGGGWSCGKWKYESNPFENQHSAFFRHRTQERQEAMRQTEASLDKKSGVQGIARPSA
nr:hypothetical protein SHINE37_60072 [Rhizobiaceae bacterium]